MTDPKEIVAAGVKGAVRGGVVAAGASVVGGAALTTAPVHLLWFIPVATTTVLSMPVVISAGAVGAVAYGGFSAYRTYRTQRSNDLLIQKALESGRKRRKRKTSP